MASDGKGRRWPARVIFDVAMGAVFDGASVARISGEVSEVDGRRPRAQVYVEARATVGAVATSAHTACARFAYAALVLAVVEAVRGAVLGSLTGRPLFAKSASARPPKPRRRAL